jgi:hypothetical protein
MTIRETAKPIEDTEVVAWAPSSGVTLYDKIAEAVADDAGFISSTATTNNSKFKLSPLKRATADGEIVISYRVKATDATDLSVQLLDGSTVVAERLHLDISATGYELLRMTLTADELALITDASNLYINFIAEHFVSAFLNEDDSRILLEDGSGVLLIERNS